jgi:hypothetical protein
MKTGLQIVAASIAVLLPVAAIAQTTMDKPADSVHISGRVMFPEGGPVSVHVRMARIEPDGLLTDEQFVLTDSHGVFTFFGTPGKRYRIDLDGYGVRTRKTVDIARGKDIDVGDMIFEKCPAVSHAVPKAPTSPELLGILKSEQIVIELQSVPRGGSGFVPLRPAALTNHKLNSAVDLPPCWSGPSLDKRTEWEPLFDIIFDRYVSIESFVGGKVKMIRVIRYDPNLTPSKVRDEVRKAWFGIFWHATSAITWAEYTSWNIEANVEYEDGKRASILTDGGHVQVRDRDGKYWYFRLWPAVD